MEFHFLTEKGYFDIVLSFDALVLSYSRDALNLFIHLSLHGHFYCFQYWDITSKLVMNTCAEMSLMQRVRACQTTE